MEGDKGRYCELGPAGGGLLLWWWFTPPYRDELGCATEKGVDTGGVDKRVLLALLDGGAGEAHCARKLLGRQRLASECGLVHLQ